MRRIILRMIATNSLSAFSSATTTRALGSTGPVRLVRSLASDTDVKASGIKSPQSGKPAVMTAPSGQNLPRGSLLNLSV